jgi:translation initiation factor IF-2
VRRALHAGAREKKNLLGLVDVRQVFKISRSARWPVVMLEGLVRRNALVRVLRDNVVVHTGEIDSLKRFKDDAREVKAGFECGTSVKNFNDLKVGDSSRSTKSGSGAVAVVSARS